MKRTNVIIAIVSFLAPPVTLCNFQDNIDALNSSFCLDNYNIPHEICFCARFSLYLPPEIINIMILYND